MRIRLLLAAAIAFLTIGKAEASGLPSDNGRKYNWIETKTYNGNDNFVRDITYYNGLGLPSQSLAVGASGDGGTVVTPVEYDDCLRADAKVWIPFHTNSVSGLPADSQQLPSSYASLYGTEAAYAFTLNGFDSASLNRKVSSRRPGSSHADADKHSVITYGASSVADSVLALKYNQTEKSVIRENHFLIGLEKTVFTDEDGRRFAEFKDAFGNVRLSRRYMLNTEGSYIPYADTYTVYDDAGRIVWVISPEGSALLAGSDSFNEASNVAKRWTTIFRHDLQGRLKARRRPGCGWEEYVYDRGGRLVLERDSVLHANGQWIYHVYDNLDREVERTIVANASPVETVQNAYDNCPHPNSYPCPSHALGAMADYRKPHTTIGDFSLVSQLYCARYGGYRYRTDTTFNATALFSIPSALAFAAETGVTASSDRSDLTSNLKIYEKVWIIGENISGLSSSDFIKRAFHYDGEGRLIQTVESNQSGGKSRTSIRYDYCDRPVKIKETHEIGNAGSQVMSREQILTYDGRGRVTSERVRVNNLPEATVSYGYDELGRQATVTYGNGVSESRTYTVQGWLKEIQALDADGNALFSERLRYWEDGTSPSLYSGVVAAAITSNGDESPLDYNYYYDYLWRMTEASLPASDAWSEKGLTYDRNGNIRSLTRLGSDGTVKADLSLRYYGNRPNQVTDQGINLGVYNFDACGRQIQEGKSRYMISYGPTGKMFCSTFFHPRADITRHSYLADGTRLGIRDESKTGTLQEAYLDYGSICIEVDQDGGSAFGSSVFGSGVILNDGPVYFSRDHLGNTRLVTDATGTVLERNDYYPLGERHDGTPSLAENRWRFAGKENLPVGNLKWIDFGERQYDSFLGRWNAIDPLAEKYPSISPYAYCADNPENLVDRNGEFPETFWDFANLAWDVQSLVSNIAIGNLSGAVIDALGMSLDAVATLVPGVPGGAATAIKAIRKTDKVLDKAHHMEKLRETARIGKNAHDMIEKEMLSSGIAKDLEVSLYLKNGTRNVRKDAKISDELYVIIKPDTPTGHIAAQKRVELMKADGYSTVIVYYDPTNPVFRSGLSFKQP